MELSGFGEGYDVQSLRIIDATWVPSHGRFAGASDHYLRLVHVSVCFDKGDVIV